MEGQATWQQFGQRVNLLEAAIFFWQLFKPYANFLVDEHLLRRAGKEMEGSAHGSLFDNTSPWQKIEARQEIGLAQDSQYFLAPALCAQGSAWFFASLEWMFP